MESKSGTLQNLLEAVCGPERTASLMKTLVIPARLLGDAPLDRALLAQALNMLLFEDLVHRVPAAQAYVARAVREGETILHDHGAVRTVDMEGMGSLPRGREAIVRLLEPLGYQLRGTYPLERLRMTGRSYAQADLPEEIAQFFISELHVDRFPPDFADTVLRTTKDSVDPLSARAQALLMKVSELQTLSLQEAAELLPALSACFTRNHPVPALADYEALLAHSAEMAWIATEGNRFNHATDRVEDVEKLTREQKALGLPMKDKVEVSGSGRVRQTAFHAARVMRPFRNREGGLIEREVPGSFLEFIARDFVPGEAVRTLDLSFDPSNAQAIFKMTAQN